MREVEEQRLGPASYKLEFKLTEQRVDKGAVKLKELFKPIKEEDNEDDRQALYPNFDHDKP